jgi:hypothetical protein
MSNNQAEMETFAAEIGFKVQGKALFPRKGIARKATDEEVALWNRVSGLLAELESIREPVCLHPSRQIRKQTGMIYCPDCGFVGVSMTRAR